MSRIKVLSDTLQNKIAAGEVIERPASIAKELIENALDAESSDIRIEILQGGKRLLKVDDDGYGMSKDDALLCFQKHATSKISDEMDLNAISTMGFRGEALSAIVSVACVKIITTPRETSVGTAVEISGGEVKSIRDTSGVGTTVEVRDLFINTPARKKFMKTDHTEQYHIIDTVTRLAIINPGVRFSLNDGGREIISLPRASDIKERVAQLFGIEFTDGLIEIYRDDMQAGISLSGFVSRPGNYRKRRSNQYLFVNGRPIMDSSLRHAIYRAFEGFIGGDEHPMYILNVAVDPGNVDVNVHPTKREIRFLYKEDIYDVFWGSIRDALRRYQEPSEGTAKAVQVRVPVSGKAQVTVPSAAISYNEGSQRGEAASVSETLELSYAVDKPFLYLGDVFVAYADREGLCIIDHHAAHERIMYEKFRKREGVEAYGLLFPRQIRLGAKEYSVLLQYRDVFLDMGFDLNDFGGNTIIVRSIPECVEEQGLESLLNDIAASLMDFRVSSPVDDIKDEMAKRIACHSSVRGKTILGKEQIHQLLNDLDKAEDPYHCPHGRPTRTSFSLDDLRKLFERK